MQRRSSTHHQHLPHPLVSALCPMWQTLRADFTGRISQYSFLNYMSWPWPTYLRVSHPSKFIIPVCTFVYSVGARDLPPETISCLCTSPCVVRPIIELNLVENIVKIGCSDMGTTSMLWEARLPHSVRKHTMDSDLQGRAGQVLYQHHDLNH